MQHLIRVPNRAPSNFTVIRREPPYARKDVSDCRLFSARLALSLGDNLPKSSISVAPADWKNGTLRYVDNYVQGNELRCRVVDTKGNIFLHNSRCSHNCLPKSLIRSLNVFLPKRTLFRSRSCARRFGHTPIVGSLDPFGFSSREGTLSPSTLRWFYFIPICCNIRPTS